MLNSEKLKVKALLGLLLASVIGLIQYDTGDDYLITEKSVALSANRIKVFQYMTDASNYERWMPGVVESSMDDVGPVQVGKYFREIHELPFIGRTIYENLIIAYESPSYISFISDSWLKPRIEMSVARRDSSQAPSLFTYKLHSRRRSLLFQYTAGPVLSMYYSTEFDTRCF